MTKRLSESFSLRVAKAQRKADRSRLLRWLGTRAMATVALGAALSVGGAAEALQGVHFLVQKNLDSVSVVKTKGHRSREVASLSDGFAANSLFKLSRVLPDRVVSHRISLFNDSWLSAGAPLVPRKADIFHT